MSPITTHVLDTARGRPADGVPVLLSKKETEGWRELGRGTTDGDGRVRELLPEGATLEAGTYKIVFDTAVYFTRLGVDGFYPWATIVFVVREAGGHYHVPLLLAPYAYSTYRGS